MGSSRRWRAPVLFLAGMIAGGSGTALIVSRGLDDGSYPREIRQGGASGLVNPLLECREGERLQSAVLPFRQTIQALVDRSVQAGDITRGSIYFRDLTGGPWFAAGSQQEYRIGSLLKVPLLLGFLKRSETDPDILQKRLRYASPTEPPGSQNVVPREPLVPGQSYTVEELLERAIVQSDNEAAALLTQEDGGRSLEAVRQLVDFPPFRDGNLYLTPRNFASLFRILFNASYLTPRDSERALELLVRSEFREGLVAGVPAGTVVANKFGERMDDGVARLHDCGIVYHPVRPYVLCVMTEGRRFDALARFIADASRLAYDEVARRRAPPSSAP